MDAQLTRTFVLRAALYSTAVLAIDFNGLSQGERITAGVIDNVKRDLGKALTFHASFDQGTDADFALGDRRIFSATSYRKREDSAPGLVNTDVSVAAGLGRHGSALQFRKKNTKAIYYQGEKNVEFRSPNWSGTASFWLSLDPNQDLEPGYCDPIQLTDKDYNDSAIWVDFTKDYNPRHFRLGIFGQLKIWNPNNTGPDQNPDFKKRLIAITKPPFAQSEWTHVVITFNNLNSSSPGSARLYLNGKLQGTTEGIAEPFAWDLSRAAIRLGLNYVGLYDEVAIFNRALSDGEVELLGKLKNGAVELHR